MTTKETTKTQTRDQSRNHMKQEIKIETTNPGGKPTSWQTSELAINP